ncbi:MAG: chemotaxis response regulator protein-glutamate methylesterase [Clostridium sp.]|uniref:protein-glutamate methylesterase/protein-glutamine glutaminase n=1 Tax=Clostridium sp. TaxID=1506 RepID=UPI0025C49588|nr:chemotaxis response regulator protein-glutamate methylesterase [Clostridium sp.]MCH3964343.1 chemotaxis response regulator protein-glutamate methylesterase [Clostridium sp.]MCI1715518.1 chemotaxis response regulator protein-glutamate methylesterase [Clostridium sp.]MCI1799690.1 chemotaxis response regulator protein-glutamate methylesterase [Clostridium sp.]MCI1813702.1 chemotaxis response regulator protein-glutamate methylesterase [Clostridium sp.]MCI1870503.1 chemotaxis response regulator 
MKKIKVLIVDDSALMRRIISDMVGGEPDMETIGTARNGEDLLEKLSGKYSGENVPDIITLDVEMPKMDGISALKEMHRRNINIPIIMLSSISKEGTKLTMECLDAGALDFVPKPSGSISLDIDKVKDELIKKIKLSYQISRQKNQSGPRAESTRTTKKVLHDKTDKHLHEVNGSIEAIVIGASTGGPKALYSVITKLPKNFGIPTFVVQHMPVGFTKAFSERLDSNSLQKVVEASDNMKIVPDTIYIAPGGFHMEVGQDRRVHLNKEPAIWGVRPAVDKLFKSAARVYGGNLISVVLTGMGRDGADGTAVIKDSGGITISEDESTCIIYGMPKAAYSTGKVEMVLKLGDITDKLVELVSIRRKTL